MSLWPAIAAMSLLAIPGMVGVLTLRRLRLGLSQLELLSYGFPLGVVVYSLLLLAASSLGGLNGWTVGLTLVACLILDALLLVAPVGEVEAGGWSELFGEATGGGRRGWGSWIPLLVLAALALRWVWFYSRLCVIDVEGLWINQVNVWADWARHFGDTASFAFSDNFPATDPRYLGHPFAYHFLISLHAAAMVRAGLDIALALPLQSLILMLLITSGLFCFYRRLSKDNQIAALALVLFFFAGGLGWWSLLSEPSTTAGGLAALAEAPWNRALLFESGIQFQNLFFSLLAPQRPFLLGVPMALLIFTLLYIGVSHRRTLPFAAAGVVAGLLPFAHLGAMLALALTVPFLMVLFITRRWWVFLSLWFVLGLPQFLMQQGGGGGVLESFRLQVGWLAENESWLRFWFENLGLFVPLVVIALCMRSLFSAKAFRFLLAMMPLFVIANLVVFQPWAWDNTKILMYWFLAGCLLIAALLVRLWRVERFVVPTRTAVVLIALTLVASGLWEHLAQALGNERSLFLTAEEIRVAAAVRRDTSARSVFAVGIQSNHPIPVLTGRQVLMSYPGWLWSHGIDYAEREADLRALYALEDRADEIIDRCGVDYVVVGPNERATLGAEPERFRQRYPILFESESYEIFAVGSGSESTTTPD